jgi:hypothetical protein
MNQDIKGGHLPSNPMFSPGVTYTPGVIYPAPTGATVSKSMITVPMTIHGKKASFVFMPTDMPIMQAEEGKIWVGVMTKAKIKIDMYTTVEASVEFMKIDKAAVADAVRYMIKELKLEDMFNGGEA